MTDLEQLKTVDQWPFQLWLPLKKYNKLGEFPDFGMVMANNLGRVFQVSFYDWQTMSVEERRKVPCIDYGSPEAVIAAGWVVD